MKSAIIYGAGYEGELAYRTLLACGINVLFFVDRDKQKIGTRVMGHEVCPLQSLEDYEDKSVPIVVAGRASQSDMREYSKKCGFYNVLVMGDTDWLAKSRGSDLYESLNSNRCISVSGFLLNAFPDGQIKLGKITYVEGGSSNLDYAFLKAVGKWFNCRTYLEIGTYIGTSIYNMIDICDICYGVSASPESEYSMKYFCKQFNIPDYSGWLTKNERIHMYYCDDSKVFDYSQIPDEIDMYFIDADHSYNGVYSDTKNVFNDKSEKSIVVWHDFQQKRAYDDVVIAVKDALGDEFENVYVTDSNLCGIYIPKCLQKNLPLTKRLYREDVDRLYYYDTTLNIGLMKK